jgi:hypothetical protein
MAWFPPGAGFEGQVAQQLSLILGGRQAENQQATRSGQTGNPQ